MNKKIKQIIGYSLIAISLILTLFLAYKNRELMLFSFKRDWLIFKNSWKEFIVIIVMAIFGLYIMEE